MIKEDIPYLELTYLLQLMEQTLNETAMYHIKILPQHEMAPNTFYKWLNIPRYRHVGDTTVERADFTWQNFEHFEISLHIPEGVT